MKAKLLKKARKRFSIVHLPNGFLSGGEHYNFNIFQLIDDKATFGIGNYMFQVSEGTGLMCKFVERTYNTEQECIYAIQRQIIKRLRCEGFKQRRDRKIYTKKIWYNKCK